MQQCSRRARRAAIAICAVAILIVRKQDQKPDDYQRLRWVLWGCLIGLPSFLLAELASETTTFEAALGFTPSDDIIGLLYLVNGVLCLFVFEAVPSERVVSVWIPIRRVTILAFIFTAPALFLHEQVQRVEEQFTLPDWAWLGLAVFVSFVISLLHDRAVDLADGFFNRGLDRDPQVAHGSRDRACPSR
jgi:drug/metabolite transporter (DMT)-like permease